jgi:3'-phosphoadenosine 5'-phosphosulfate sulfotransferase (PAPS reductase)/FAD synthetase
MGDRPREVADPFLITGPAAISFSGGRTSGYMLWRILQAHGGTLPDDVVVCFANTGREMPATLDFVRDCGAAWGVCIHWLEYRYAPGEHQVIEVSHNSASRDGEPFEHVLRSRKMLPNPVMRFCTVDLKIRTVRRFIQREYGWDKWTQVVGLRADEPRRVQKATDPVKQKKNAEPGWVICPLSSAGVQEIDVLRFWKAQPFNLRLKGSWEGNCDGCFLKNRGGISRMARDYPERLEWWAKMEATARGRTDKPEMGNFRADREDYATLLQITRDQGVLPFDLEDSIACEDAACGV